MFFSTAAPVSLYGATKLASEALALEYSDAFGLPANRPDLRAIQLLLRHKDSLIA
jgi:hypothetical protein